jgi:hypothetical protein
MESRQIKGYEDYTVYANGFVMNKHGRFLKPRLNNHGYLMIDLYKNGIRKTMKIHRIVCEAFNENPDNKKCVDHIDRNKENNWKSNLRFCTDSENNKNQSKRENTLYRGVCFDKKMNSWRSRYCDSEGKIKTKSFSVNKYGNKESLRLAVEARYQAEIDYDYTILQTPSEFFKSDDFINVSE